MEKVAMDISFFEKDTVQIARELLGCTLIHHTPIGPIGGIIVETEAYLSRGDLACHSACGETKRNRTMFQGAGLSYVYQIYGIHYCYNVTTNLLEKPEAVLIRALKPTIGIEIMQKKRNQKEIKRLCSGPGKLTQALGIDLRIDGKRVDEGPVKIYPGAGLKKKEIVTTTRIGISVACELPLRFYIKGSNYISKK